MKWFPIGHDLRTTDLINSTSYEDKILQKPTIEKGLVSRLDHAAYLGKELARADESLRSGDPYVQDAAP